MSGPTTDLVVLWSVVLKRGRPNAVRYTPDFKLSVVRTAQREVRKGVQSESGEGSISGFRGASEGVVECRRNPYSVAFLPSKIPPLG